MSTGGDEACRTSLRLGNVPTEDQRRRPATRQRTGRARLRAPDLHTQSEASSWASTRHATIRHETGGNPVAILNRLLNTLHENGVPGPQLFRLESEFSFPLGEGGQGNVRGLDLAFKEKYRRTHKRIRKTWPVERIAIKQHLGRAREAWNGGQKPPVSQDDLCSRFRAAECEVLALAPGLFRNEPNIVKLVGWGLCLDTMEDPTSPCCRGLQLPLLVFERAEMDLAQLLGNLFPHVSMNGVDESRIERGIQMNRRWWSRWSNFEVLMGLQEDPYEVVRLLCVDVGHGLRSLHDNNFTHGDLKPENVLVFQTEKGWTAKLCDFGCAVGRDKLLATNDDGPTLKPKQQKETYLGTPHWSPSSHELSALDSFDDLRKCDLYVYGLLVWSSFCLGGKPPPLERPLRSALDDLQDLSAKAYPLLPALSERPWLFNQVGRLLEDTMASPARRSPNPWSYLYRRSKQRLAISNLEGATGLGSALVQTQTTFDTENIWNFFTTGPSHVRSFWGPAVEETRDNDTTTTPPPQVPVNLKAEYMEQDWWKPAETISTGSLDHTSGPASLLALPSDEDCLGTALFSGKRRQQDAQSLGPDMLSLLSSTGPTVEQKAGRLYHLARFRSRIPHRQDGGRWWTLQPTTEDENILMMALKAHPPVDINTLAWLCAGPVGRAEIKALRGYSDKWRWQTILGDADLSISGARLDESVRLDRFLLLLQFGAHVEDTDTNTLWRGRTASRWIASASGFSQYIQSCRNAAIPTIVSEIFRRLERGMGEGRIAPETIAYFIEHEAMAGGAVVPIPGKVLKHLYREEDEAARSAVRRYIAGGIGPLFGTEEDPLLSKRMTSERTTPLGWKKVTNSHVRRGVSCYEDDLTNSITLQEPRVSTIKMRQVKVGSLHDDSNGLSVHLDMLSCMRAGEDKADQHRLDQDLHDRFPYYDDAWFAEEWTREPNTNDVLKRIEEPWRIRTFNGLLQTRAISAVASLVARGKHILAIGVGYRLQVLQVVPMPRPRTYSLRSRRHSM